VRRYALLGAGLVGFFLAAFLLAEAVGVPLLTDPSPWLRRGGPLAAVLGVALLVVDVFLPVPSSVIMVSHGAMFGVILGALLSTLGSHGAACLGFAVGRRGEAWIARVASPAEKARADRLLRRHGAVAIVVTRPVPLLAETVAVLAGASSMTWRTMIAATLGGAVPGSVLYAIAGALAPGVDNAFLAFALVLAIAGLTWWLGARGGRGDGAQGGGGQT
jgi:3-dehydroquinate synthase